MTPYLFGILKKKKKSWIKYLLAKSIFWSTYKESEAVTGESAILSKSIRRPLIEFSLFGNSYQEETPTPETPKDVESVGDDGSITIVKSNKNFLDVASNLEFTRSKTIRVNIPAGTYHITNKSAIASDNSNYVTIRFNTNAVSYNLSTSQDRTVTLATDETTVYLFARTDYPSSANITATIKDLMISINGGEYVERETKTYKLPVQKPLCKIGETQDSLIFQNGKWYELHRINKGTITGEETGWSLQNDCFTNNVFSDIKPTPAYADRNQLIILSNYFKGGLSNYRSTLANTNYQIAKAIDGANPKQVAIVDTDFDNSTDFIAWVQEHNIECTYIKEEHELIECTELQKEILNEIINDGTFAQETIFTSTDDIKPSLRIKYWTY